AEELARRAEDAQDQNIPWMIWYGLEQRALQDPGPCHQISLDCEIPLLREYLTRRLAAASDQELDGLMVDLREENPTRQRDVLRGLHEALKGRRSVPMPRGWEEVYRNLAESPLAEVRERSTALAVLFGDQRALT